MPTPAGSVTSTWMACRPTHETECCSGNVHRLMPNSVTCMWLRSREGAIAAALYGPSAGEFDFPTAASGCIEQRTSYPFDGEIEFVFSMKGKAEIPFQLRIPGWCDGASIRINGKPWKGECPRGSFVTIRRKFRDDGRIRLHLGMEPAGAWNYALCPETGWNPKVVRTQTAAQVGYPFDRESVPVKVRVPVKRIDWMLEEGRYTPRLPEGGKARAISDDIEYLELIPYGCTELRLTVFPVVE